MGDFLDSVSRCPQLIIYLGLAFMSVGTSFFFTNAYFVNTKNGGIAICAPIAPYSRTRKLVRDDIEKWGTFIEVHIATSLEECERRDRKGLYKLAREGKIKEFTGISDPYESPKEPELRIETENISVENCAQKIILKLKKLNLVKT